MATNTHDQLRLAGGGVAIIASYSQGRDSAFNGWSVYRVGADGKQIDTAGKDAPWYHCGKKYFPAQRAGRMDSLESAKAYVRAKGWYDGPWVRNRMYDYVPKAINEQFPLPKPQRVRTG